jgi:hypothetical protein
MPEHFQDAVWTLEKNRKTADPDPRFNRRVNSTGPFISGEVDDTES